MQASHDDQIPPVPPRRASEGSVGDVDEAPTAGDQLSSRSAMTLPLQLLYILLGLVVGLLPSKAGKAASPRVSRPALQVRKVVTTRRGDLELHLATPQERERPP